MRDEKNQFIIPDGPAISRRGCPKCGSEKFNGRKVYGSILFTCGNPNCRNEWQGGLAQEPWRASDPRPPDPKGPVEFHKNEKGEWVETRRHVNNTPDFRRGALLPDGEE